MNRYTTLSLVTIFFIVIHHLTFLGHQDFISSHKFLWISIASSWSLFSKRDLFILAFLTILDSSSRRIVASIWNIYFRSHFFLSLKTENNLFNYETSIIIGQMFSTENSLNFGTITSIAKSFLSIYALLLILIIPLSVFSEFISSNASIINKIEEDDSLLN